MDAGTLGLPRPLFRSGRVSNPQTAVDLALTRRREASFRFPSDFSGPMVGVYPITFQVIAPLPAHAR